MNKSYRQGQILNLIRGRAIRTQDELARALKALGIGAAQVTLSRDIRELGLVKTADGYRQMRHESAGPDFASVVANFLMDVRVARNLVILKTSPANANTLAAALDRHAWPEVIGTIAGDDTVLAVSPDDAAAGRLRERLLRLLAPG
ncbi:MAG: ArgR family transcriptional regulator [Bryobacterales bacterium]|mgnify:CR=1 FL=1|nr:ArgR family transcriptional regulator [Bryobacterales bacterium]